MAERPIFIPSLDEAGLVEVRSFSFAWNPGFALVQKRKNITALHEAAARYGHSPLLEISTKSVEELGRQLSAFNLKVKSQQFGEIPLECAFQGSKVFQRGGPYTDLYHAEPRDAKRDSRMQESGRLVGFSFENRRFPLEPKTAFYDWLYFGALFPQRAALGQPERPASQLRAHHRKLGHRALASRQLGTPPNRKKMEDLQSYRRN
jgi:hypothetical protein